MLAVAVFVGLVPVQKELLQDARLRPVTGPIHHVEARLDTRTGRLVRAPAGQEALLQGSGGLESVYDNTCFAGGVWAGLGAAPSGPETIGDYGALPSELFAGDAFCTPGCASSYDITAFEISWCTRSVVSGGATVELYFWDPPQLPCQPGSGPFGGTLPPATPAVFQTTLSGLPQTANPGVLACYALTVHLDEPFELGATDAIVQGGLENENFAWSFAIPTSTGADGPLLAGDLRFTTACLPCVGTLFEVGGQSTNQGTGAGQRPVFFLEAFGSTSPSSGGDCFFFGSAVPTGLHLELYADTPCPEPLGSAFCDGSDGALSLCPCSNPGGQASGCDIQQGTGGVRLRALDQQTTPSNRVTLEGLGFPESSNPTAVVIRAPQLDSGGPIVFGDGVRCIASSVVRMSATFASARRSTHALMHAAGAGTFFYQLWFRNQPATYCTPDAFNASSGRALTW